MSERARATGGGEESGDKGAGPARRKERLYDRAFVGILGIDFLAFVQWFSLQPVIPLLVLDLGGDAAMAGLAFAVFSIPSIIMRPVFGRLIDRVGATRILLLGTLGIGLLGLGYLLGSLLVIILVRAVHGVAWAAVMTSAAALMAHLAPATRRGEAAAVFDLMPGTAQMLLPAVGLLLFSATGPTGTFLFVAAVGLLASLLVITTSPPDAPRPRRSAHREGAGESLPILEPSAVLPMVIQMLFMSASPLFVVYPPILATDRGIPLSDLAIYYPVYGILLVGSRLMISRVLDSVSRTLLVAGSAVGAIIALLFATQADSIMPLLLAGSIFAIGCGVSVPVGTATVIDRSPPHRMGSAMGTYTIGFQLASGLGAAIWGVVIEQGGFTAAFLGAALVQAVLVVVAIVYRKGLERPPGIVAHGTAGAATGPPAP